MEGQDFKRPWSVDPSQCGCGGQRTIFETFFPLPPCGSRDGTPREDGIPGPGHLFLVSGDLTGTLEAGISVFSLLCWLQVSRFLLKATLMTPCDSRPGPTTVPVCLGCALRFLLPPQAGLGFF